ncbi:HDOD domain-containing protein [Hippea maritima]|uniref:Putative signal transduction protein n=1 Tax=Hippea maritima (strain ATCC 700847 / DSM 10411 / MH2) TaxID=760142 RepID=F2LXP5_HIPMA|nr:HDOD domain-containing protein [Hippea maritima]AEA34286.1 putative signal transduction protein [Hippea maritima DSM 10411]
MNKIEELYNNLGKIEDLPAFPAIAFEVIKLTRDPDTTSRNLEDVIKKDPNLVSQILKMANSSLYGLSREITSLNHAINLLGFVQVENIVMISVILSSVRKLPLHKKFNRDKFLEHSFGCGVTAKIISNILNLNFSSAEFSGGVIHDIGKVLLDLYAPECLDLILENAYNKGISFIESEMELYGVNHSMLGAKLLSIWGLPEEIIDIAENHHSPLNAHNKLLVSAVHVADLLTYSEGIGFGGNYAKFTLEEDDGWQFLIQEANLKEEFDLAYFTFKLYEEIDNAKQLYFEES